MSTGLLKARDEALRNFWSPKQRSIWFRRPGRHSFPPTLAAAANGAELQAKHPSQ
jgi:hypothetical protein